MNNDDFDVDTGDTRVTIQTRGMGKLVLDIQYQEPDGLFYVVGTFTQEGKGRSTGRMTSSDASLERALLDVIGKMQERPAWQEGCNRMLRRGLVSFAANNELHLDVDGLISGHSATSALRGREAYATGYAQ